MVLNRYFLSSITIHCTLLYLLLFFIVVDTDLVTYRRLANFKIFEEINGKKTVLYDDAPYNTSDQYKILIPQNGLEYHRNITIEVPAKTSNVFDGGNSYVSICEVQIFGGKK